jgi:hypothetical protein
MVITARRNYFMIVEALFIRGLEGVALTQPCLEQD